MADIWYIDTDGQIEGPFPLGELRARAADGRLLPTTGVSPDRARWIAAHDVPGLTFPAPGSRPLVETVVSSSAGAHTASPPAAISPLDSVPGYQVQDTLGAGACGVVFRAVQVKLNRVVALKTVRLAENTSPDMISRFEQEAVSLARLQHPNIVAVYDCGHSHGRAFFAMELLDGEDLAARIEREAGPLDERTAWLIARQTAAALGHAARQGIVHRDVKPANLFLVPAPTGFPLPPDVPMVKVTDFGLALARNPGDSDQRTTAAGVLLGSPVYMAPEQFAGSTVDARADMYSLGATVFHMLAGRAPFDGRTIWEVLMQKSAAPPRLGPGVSPETADLVVALMAQQPEDRPADYAALIARIDALPRIDGAFSVSGLPSVTGRMAAASGPEPEPVRAPAPAPRKRRRWVYAVAALALLGAAVGIAAVAGAFDRKRTTYKPTGAQQLLYTSGKLEGWFPDGGEWGIEKDEDSSPTLAGWGKAVRPLDPPEHFRVTLSLDPYRAKSVELVFATTDDPPATATQWLVRLDPATGAEFGKRVGPGQFQRVGNVVPIPTPQELAARGTGPYVEVRYERAGGELTASFRTETLGTTRAKKLLMNELRVHANGPVRIREAAIEELVEVK